MKAYLGSASIAPRILNIGIRWKWVVSFTPWPLYSRNRRRYWTEDWVEPRAGLDAVEKTKDTFPAPVENRTSVVQPLASSLFW